MFGPLPPIRPIAPPMWAVHERLLPLTEPSLQRNVSPRHPAMPPLLPLHGVLAALAWIDGRHVTNSAKAIRRA